MRNLAYLEGRSANPSGLSVFLSGGLRPTASCHTTRSTRTPVVEVVDTDTSYLMKVELPGVRKEDLDITIKERILTIQAEVKESREESEGTRSSYLESEKKRFIHAVNLESNIDDAGIFAKMRNGVLDLTLPKVSEIRSRKIEVAAA